VTLTDQQTTIARIDRQEERGEYVVPAVEPGTYGLKAALRGYKSVEQLDVRVG
jgi:hypothetical protein